MKPKSIKGNSPEEIKTALEESMADGYQSTLTFVFFNYGGFGLTINGDNEFHTNTCW